MKAMLLLAALAAAGLSCTSDEVDYQTEVTAGEAAAGIVCVHYGTGLLGGSYVKDTHYPPNARAACADHKYGQGGDTCDCGNYGQ